MNTGRFRSFLGSFRERRVRRIPLGGVVKHAVRQGGQRYDNAVFRYRLHFTRVAPRVMTLSNREFLETYVGSLEDLVDTYVSMNALFLQYRAGAGS